MILHDTLNMSSSHMASSHMSSSHMSSNDEQERRQQTIMFYIGCKAPPAVCVPPSCIPKPIQKPKLTRIPRRAAFNEFEED